MSRKPTQLHAQTAHRIDYATALRGAHGAPYLAVAQRLLTDLPARWDMSYRAMCGREVSLVTAAHEGRLVRVEIVPRPRRRTRRTPPHRVVAMYGRSHYYWQGTNDDAIDVFLAARAKRGPSPAGTPSGRAGWLDVSALLDAPVEFGRRRTVPEMERHCASNPGTFFFVRPVYGDAGARPIAVDYGVLRTRDDFWLERFIFTPSSPG